MTRRGHPVPCIFWHVRSCCGDRRYYYVDPTGSFCIAERHKYWKFITFSRDSNGSFALKRPHATGTHIGSTTVAKQGTRRSLPQAQMHALEPQARAARRARIGLTRCPASARCDREQVDVNQPGSAWSLSGREGHALGHNLRTSHARDACQRSGMCVGMRDSRLGV